MLVGASGLQYWLPFVSALLGTLVGAGVTMFSQWRVELTAGDRERREDARRLRDAKAERLRAIYVRVGEAASALQFIVADQVVVFQGDTAETRDERHKKILDRVGEDFERLWTSIVLEPGAEPVGGAFDRAMKAFQQVQISRSINKDFKGTIPYAEIDQQTKDLKTAVDEVLAAAKKHLGELTAPI